MILRDLIISEMRKNNWDVLPAKDRLELLDQIKKNFDQSFEDIRQKRYPNTTKGIRLHLAKRIFSKLYKELIDKKLCEIQNVIMSENRIKDLEESIIKRLESEFLKFPEEIILPISSYEEEMKYIIYLRAFGRIKNLGLNDMAIFREVYSAVRKGVCDNMIIISKDSDLANIKGHTLSKLREFIENSKNPDHQKYAKEIINLISSNIKVEILEEVLKS
jgi:hypothetical protein